MKKSLAALGASVFGLAGALGASAAPASAVVVTPPCTDATNALEHVVKAGENGSDSWYMSCVPQYGMGKAEFTITPPAGQTAFPDGFSLTDGKNVVVSSTPNSTEVANYFGSFYAVDHSNPVYTGAFINLAENTTESSPTSQSYGSAFTPQAQTVAFPISSVGKAATVPAACLATDPTATFQGVYVINYAPVTTTWSEQIGANNYVTTVTLTQPQLTLALNFGTSEGGFGFDENAPLCATSSAGTVFAPNDVITAPATATTADSGTSGDAPTDGSVSVANTVQDANNWNAIAHDAATNNTNDLTTLLPITNSNTGQVTSLGTFAVRSDPILAETGVDAAPAGILGGSLAVVGLGAFLFGRRRRTVVRSR